MLDRKTRRINRVRAKISGTAEYPRLAVFRSLKHISGQLIDDVKGVTLISASDEEVKEKVAPIEIAKMVGEILAKKALEKKIKQAVFDRRSYRYHGRVKAFAEGARFGGLQI